MGTESQRRRWQQWAGVACDPADANERWRRSRRWTPTRFAKVAKVAKVAVGCELGMDAEAADAALEAEPEGSKPRP